MIVHCFNPPETNNDTGRLKCPYKKTVASESCFIPFCLTMYTLRILREFIEYALGNYTDQRGTRTLGDFFMFLFVMLRYFLEEQ